MTVNTDTAHPWSDIKTPATEFHTRAVEIDSRHPLKWGKDLNGHFLLIIQLNGDLIDQYMAQKLSLTGMSTDLRSLEGKQIFVLKLERSVDVDLFHALCNTLITKISSIDDSSVLLAVTFQHLKRWKTFLASGKTRLLTPEEQRGLFCEIKYLENLILDTKMDAEEALDAWNGPDKLQQDFVYHDKAVEVKSLFGTSKNTVKITSEEQLESVCSSLFLCVFRISDQSDSEKAMSLNQLVTHMESMLEGDASQLFIEKIGAVGYVPMKEYDNPAYLVNNIYCFKVLDDFPRIIRSGLSAAILKVKYELQLNHISNFICEKDELWGQ